MIEASSKYQTVTKSSYEMARNIPLPETLTPGPARSMRECKYCVVRQLCKTDVSAGLPCHCEATASVFIGGALVTL